MRAVLTIAAKDLRLRARDRSSFVIGIAAPLGLALILNLVLGGTDADAFEAGFGVADADRGAAGEGLVEQLMHLDDRFDVTTDLTEAEARRQVDAGDLDAAFVIPEGFSQSLDPRTGAEPEALRVIVSPEDDLAAEIASSLADGYVAQVEAVRLGVAASVTVDPTADAAALVGEARRQVPPVLLAQLPASDRQLDTTTYLAAGLAVLFSFFLVQFGVRGLLEERQAGTMARLLAAPVPRLAIPLAKALTSVVLGVAALVVLAVASTVIMGADWGDPVAVLVLIVAVVLAAVSIMGLVAGVAKTPDAAGSAQAVVALTLGILGGSFFPVSQGEGVLTRLAALTPHHWFLLGLGEASAGGVADVVRPAGVLLLFAVVVGAAGAVLLSRETAA